MRRRTLGLDAAASDEPNPTKLPNGNWLGFYYATKLYQIEHNVRDLSLSLAWSLILLWVIESGCPIHRSNNMGSVWSVVRSAEHLRGICRPQRVLWRNTLYYIIWVLSMVVNYIYQDQFIASFRPTPR